MYKTVSTTRKYPWMLKEIALLSAVSYLKAFVREKGIKDSFCTDNKKNLELLLNSPEDKPLLSPNQKMDF